MADVNGILITLIVLLIVVAAIVIYWLVCRQHKLMNVIDRNANNQAFNRAYTDLQLNIDQLEADLTNIVRASINKQLDSCRELVINRYPDRVEDLTNSFTELKAIATADPDIIISGCSLANNRGSGINSQVPDSGQKLTQAVNTYTQDMANASQTFERSVVQGSVCQGPAFDAVSQQYIIARPNIQTLNMISNEITTSLQ